MSGMSDDSDPYLYPGTDVLKNVPDLRGAVPLAAFEGARWGRLAACAAVGYRRCPVQTRGYPLGRADCQSAKAYQAAPQQRSWRRTRDQIQAVLLTNRVGIHSCVAHHSRSRPPRHDIIVIEWTS